MLVKLYCILKLRQLTSDYCNADMVWYCSSSFTLKNVSKYTVQVLELNCTPKINSAGTAKVWVWPLPSNFPLFSLSQHIYSIIGWGLIFLSAKCSRKWATSLTNSFAETLQISNLGISALIQLHTFIQDSLPIVGLPGPTITLNYWNICL